MLRPEHLRLIAGHSVRHGIRGGAGLVSLLLTLLLGLVMATVVISPIEAAQKRSGELSTMSGRDEGETSSKIDMLVKTATVKAIDFAVDPTPEQLSYLVDDHPSTASAILVLLFLITPLLSCLGGFNQTSGDIGSKGLRYLLFRTERQNIFLGRFIGTYLFSAAVYLTLFVILTLYVIAKVHVPGQSAGAMTLWLFSGYLRLLAFSLPYIAFCSLISCAMSSPFGSLVISLLVAYVFPVVVLIAAGAQPLAAKLNYLTPWGYKWWLLASPGGLLFPGIAVMLAFSALFVWAGLRHFSKRDL